MTFSKLSRFKDWVRSKPKAEKPAASLKKMASLRDFAYSSLAHGHIRLARLHPAFEFDEPVRVSIEHHDFTRSKQLFDCDPEFWKLKSNLELARCESEEWNATRTKTAGGEDGLPVGPFWDVEARFKDISTLLKQLEQHRNASPAKSSLSTETNIEKPPVSYEAVSYAWGVENELESIVEVEMLRYLRQRSTPRYLWIDAICINQSSNDERNTQVRIMGEIYSYASRVLVWIGPPHPAYSVLDIPDNGSLNTTTLLPLQEVLRRRWFSRGWVVEEVVHAREAVLMCGQRSREISSYVGKFTEGIHYWDEQNAGLMSIRSY